MQLPEQEVNLVSSGGFVQSNYEIEVSAHAFSVLSKGLYSDPYRAIVRELACNAWDAHVEAGTTSKPFEVYLPNTLSPVFKIRDYGVGLSENSLLTVYKTWFKSTKQSNNEMTGCFGLGSKSPYAYTKKFTVISFYNGTRYHYVSLLNEAGLPGLLKMGEEPTTELNGLEVSFAVKPGDFYDFILAARRALRPFVLPPTVKGAADFKTDKDPPSVIEGQQWKVFAGGDSKLVMGNVEYPLNPDSYSLFSENAVAVLKSGALIHFPLGSFEITPSRESVQWTDFSIRNVGDRLEQVYDEITQTCEERLAECKSLWDARVNYRKFSTHLSRFNLEHLTWRGIRLTSMVDLASTKRQSTFSFTRVKCEEGRQGRKVAKQDEVTRILPHDSDVFYLDDLFKGGRARVCAHVRTTFSEGSCAYVISGVRSRRALKAVCAALGFGSNQLLLTSSLPKPSVLRSGTSSSSGVSSPRTPRSKISVFTYQASSVLQESWTAADIDLESGGVYVELMRFKPAATAFHKENDFLAAMRAIKTLDLKLPGDRLVGVKTSKAEAFASHAKWQTLDVWLVAQLQSVWLGDKELSFALGHHNLEYGCRRFAVQIIAIARHTQVSWRSPVALWSQTLTAAEKKAPKAQTILRLCDVLNTHLGEVGSPNLIGQFSAVPLDGDKWIEWLKSRYPLLTHCSGCSYSEFAPFIEYIDMVDSVKGDPDTWPFPYDTQDPQLPVVADDQQQAA